MKTASLLFCLASITMYGCSVDYTAHVESNTEWTGVFAGETYDGKGSAVIELGDNRCCTVWLKDSDGYIRVRVESRGGGIFNPGDSDWIETRSTQTTPVSYTHLTLPTKRIV